MPQTRFAFPRSRAFFRFACLLLAPLLVATGAPPASAASISINTTGHAGQDATLSISLLDGDFAANNQATISNLQTDGVFGAATCSVGCQNLPPFTLDDAAGFGEFLQALTLGSFVSFELNLTNAFDNSLGGSSDLVIGELLDSSSFAIFDTNLDDPNAPVPYQDALFVANTSGSVLTAANVTSVPEPATIALACLGFALLLMRRRAVVGAPLSLAFAALLSAGVANVAQASSHREAPITAIDTKADITDWYAFVSYDDPHKVTMILNVDPFLQPANGPMYFPFDHEVQYDLKVDNNFDADEDVIVRVTFAKPEVRLPGVFTGFVGVGGGVNTPANSPPPVAPGTPLLPPAITTLDGPGSEGLSLRQTYRVKILRKQANGAFQVEFDSGAKKLFAVPSNVGPRTMPNYANLARQGIYDLGDGIKVFAGTVDDPFYIDLGGAFDSLNFRADASGAGVRGVLSDAQDGDDTVNFAADSVSGFNVNTIAIELPVTMLTSDGQVHAAGDARAVIGTYATTSRPRIKVQSTVPGGKPALSTTFTAIQRMGNPLINELIIGTADKDKFSMSEPKDDAQFAKYFLDPLFARVVNAAYGGAVPIPTPPRTDLLPLVVYKAPICPGCSAAQAGPVADLLRLNTGIAATAKAQRKRLGFIVGDNAGFPNGRRVSDDVVDIASRVAVGLLAGPPFNQFPNNRIGDGTNANEVPYHETFPYVAFAHDGRNSRRTDPGEPGCVTVTVPFMPTTCPVN